MDPSSASVAIVGRPNVGKSTLFNRLIGRRLAVTAKEAGTTRDRVQCVFDIEGYKVNLIDTGGLSVGKKENLEADMELQAKIGIESADVILFVVDTIQSLTVEDFEVASTLRKTKKPVILVANKCESQQIEENIYNIYELGFDDPIQTSAIHKTGISTLKNEILSKFKELKIKKKTKKETKTREDEGEGLFISIVGRPNAGKSSLTNSLVGENRTIVSDIPGTTRDATDTEITHEGKKVVLTDTAGLRRRGKIKVGIEKFSSIRCKESIARSEVAIVVLDATEPVTSQDLHIVEIALKEKKGLIIAINKVDLSDEQAKLEIIGRLQQKCDFIPWAPIVFISAKNSKNIFKLIDLAFEIHETRKIEISTSRLTNFLRKITLKHLPSGTKTPKFFYANQAGKNPPKFFFFFKNASSMHFSYKRYLENQMRKEFGFAGTPISITFKETSSSVK